LIGAESTTMGATIARAVQPEYGLLLTLVYHNELEAGAWIGL
jgi:hypothetical protein